MNKFLIVFLSLCILGQYTQARSLRRHGRKLSFSFRLKKGLNGDLHPKHRHLSEEGQLNLGISGRGYFAYRLRVQATNADGDPSQQVPTGGDYDQAYHEGSDKSSKGTATITTAINKDLHTLTAGSAAPSNFEKIKEGDKIEVSVVSGDNNVCARAGNYTVKKVTAGTNDNAGELETNEKLPAQTAGDKCEVKELDRRPASNSGASAGQISAPEGVDIPNGENGEDSEKKFSQTVYSRDGSLHVNRFGYLVDDNGLLLIGASDRTTDANAKHHIHIPSRAEGIVVTPTGKVLAEELGGSKYSNVGQIKLTRFENQQGLNIRMKMKSNCIAADEDGFALGNWCAGSDLDGKDHTYYAESIVSGPGIIGNPGEQGFGRITR